MWSTFDRTGHGKQWKEIHVACIGLKRFLPLNNQQTATDITVIHSSKTLKLSSLEIFTTSSNVGCDEAQESRFARSIIFREPSPAGKD